ncbi:MAG: acyltransferase family protein [Cytophagaceae bacterium]
MFKRFKNAINNDERIGSIDIFRALAIISVMLSHYNDFVPGFYKFGGLGVDLFFVISGFLVSSYLIQEFDTKNKISYSGFILRRAFKILPSYYFFLIVGYIFAIIFIMPIRAEQVPLITELPQYFLFYRNYGGPPERMTFDHAWSLCVEEHFYITLPLLFIICLTYFSGKKKWLFIIVLSAIIFTYCFKIFSWITLIAEYPTYSHNRVDALSLGVLLALLIYYFKDRLKGFTKNPFLFISAFSVLMAMLFFHEYFEEGFFNIVLHHTVGPICFFVMLLSLYDYKFRLLTPLKFIAYYSYNLYLWHFLIVIPVNFYLGNTFAGFFTYIIISFVLAIFFTWLIEEKFLALRDRFLQRKSLAVQPDQII